MKRTLLVLALFLTCLIASPAKADSVTDVYLYGPGGTGGTTTITNSSASSFTVGTTAGAAVFWTAQSFQVSSGIPSQLTILFGANTGTPTGTMTYDIMSNNVAIPGTSLISGTFTPTASATNTISISTSVFLTNGITYWLQLKSTTNQTAGNAWNVRINTTDLYSNGMAAQTTSSGANWSIITADDVVISVTTVSGAAPASLLNDKLAQSFTVSQATTISAVSINLKKVGSPTGTLTLSLESDAGQMPSGTEAITGATVTLAESSLTTSYAMTAFTLSSPVILRPGVLYWWNLTTDRTDSTVYVVWGATGTCTGQYFRNHQNGAWLLQQYIGTFEMTIDSIAQPASADYITLSSGTTGTVDYSITGGEAALFGLGIVFLVLMIYGLFQLRQR